MFFKFVKKLVDVGVLIIGMFFEIIYEVEDCVSFNVLCECLGLLQLRGKVVQMFVQVWEFVVEFGFLLMVWFSYVFGGWVMCIVCSMDELIIYLDEVYVVVEGQFSILFDQFLEGVLEFDVDIFCDGECVVVVGIMEYVEVVGVYSGDSVCIFLFVMLDVGVLECVKVDMECFVLELGVWGLMNVQWVVKDGIVYILEVNFCVSCIVLFVFKVVNYLFVKSVVCIVVGQMLEQIGLLEMFMLCMYLVKEVYLLFLKFKDVLFVLGLEMKSIGESMGIDSDLYLVFYWV